MRRLSDREDDLTLDANNMNLDGYLRLWLADSVRDDVRPPTYEGYSRRVRNHIAPTLGGIET